MTGGAELTWPSELRHTATRDRWFGRFSQLPRGMNLREITAELNEAYASVCRWADIFHYPFPDLRRERSVLVSQWDGVDWRKRDAEIARDLDISRERVRQVRALRGAGLCAPRALVQRFSEWIVANRRNLHGLPVDEALEMFGGDLSPQVARRLLRVHQVRTRDPASRWRNADWRLPNRDLARIWSTTAKYIANIRTQLGAGPAQWSAKSSRVDDSVQYQLALAQEMIKSNGVRRAGTKSEKTPATANV